MRDPDPGLTKPRTTNGPLEGRVRPGPRERNNRLVRALGPDPTPEQTLDLALQRDVPPLAAVSTFSENSDAPLIEEDVLHSQPQDLHASQPREPLERDDESLGTLSSSIQGDKLLSSQPPPVNRCSGRESPKRSVSCDRIFRPSKELPYRLKVDGEGRRQPRKASTEGQYVIGLHLPWRSKGGGRPDPRYQVGKTTQLPSHSDEPRFTGFAGGSLRLQELVDATSPADVRWQFRVSSRSAGTAARTK